jgi:ribonuclease P protein component
MEHLKGKVEIREVFSRGKKIGCPGAKLFVLKNGLEYNRICFTFPRKFGNAVERNRARRLGREAYRLIRPRLRTGFDMTLLVFADDASNSVPKADLAYRMKQLEFLTAKAGLLMEI